jgi:DnaJ-domain-containing protein 1
MAKKARRQERVRAPESEYRDADGSLLALRGALTPATRAQYAAALSGNLLSREDAWQRSVEFLFERLAVRWEIGGAEPLTRQKDLLARFRFASQDERRWIRDVLREHLAEHFPDMEAP